LTADAFIHLPNLRERVTKPEQSLLRLTPEMFAMWEQRARAAGWPASWRLPDDVIEASRLALLGDHRSGDDLWIYSYGSLMWDPGFHFAEVRLADVENYQRRFTLKIELPCSPLAKMRDDETRAEPLQLATIAFGVSGSPFVSLDRLGEFLFDSGPKHLNGDLATLGRHRSMHLCDRGGPDGDFVEL